MKRFVIICFLIPFMLSAAPSASFLETTIKSLVVVSYVEGEETRQCTGFVVSASKGEVLTAAHCVPHNTTDPVEVNSELSTVIRRSDSLALLQVVPTLRPPLDIRKNAVDIGEKIYAFGFAWDHLVVVQRNVAAFFGPDFGVDGPLAPGMSGGPMVDTQGKVVGVNQATNEVLGLACGPQEIRTFLEGK